METGELEGRRKKEELQKRKRGRFKGKRKDERKIKEIRNIRKRSMYWYE